MQKLNNNGPQPAPQTVQVDISQLPNIACRGCQAIIFNQGVILKEVSAIISPTGKKQLITVPTWICSQCGLEFDKPPKEKDAGSL